MSGNRTRQRELSAAAARRRAAVSAASEFSPTQRAELELRAGLTVSAELPAALAMAAWRQANAEREG